MNGNLTQLEQPHNNPIPSTTQVFPTLDDQNLFPIPVRGRGDEAQAGHLDTTCRVESEFRQRRGKLMARARDPLPGEGLDASQLAIFTELRDLDRARSLHLADCAICSVEVSA